MPKIIGSSLEEHRTEMHRRIFDALSELLGACGYDSVGLADVAKRAGIGRTAMYNYYPDKESLILAFAAAETERFLGELEATLKSASTPIDQLRAYLAALIHEIAAQPFSTTAMSQVMSEEGRQAMREHVAPLWHSLRTILEDAIADRYLPPGDVQLRLQLVFGAANGRVTAGLAGAELERAIGLTADFCLRGLGAKIGGDGRPRRLPR